MSDVANSFSKEVLVDNRYGRSKIPALILAVIFAFIFNEAAYSGIGASPENIELMVSQDSETRGVYTVVNDGAVTAHVKVDVEDWFKSRLGKEGPPVESWLKISPTEFDIEPKESKEVEYVITAPKGDESEVAAMVFFGAPSDNEGFSITSRFGVSIYAAIKDNVRLGCELKGISVYRNIVGPTDGVDLNKKDIMFTIAVENTGNVHLRPVGAITVNGENGATYNVPIERGFPAYPGKALNVEALWKITDLRPGKYTADISIDYGTLYKQDGKLIGKISFVVNKNGNIEAAK